MKKKLKPSTRKINQTPAVPPTAADLGLSGPAADAAIRKGAADATGLDAFRNFPARMGYATPSLAEGTEYELVRWSNNYWLMLTLFRNHWIARRIVEAPAQEMTRAWPRLISEMSPDDIAQFDREIQKLMIPARIQTAIKWARLFGGGGCLMVIEGHEDMLDQPLLYKDINPGTFRGLIPFDRWAGITPDGVLWEDMDYPLEYGLPEFYMVNNDAGESFRVHSTRILRFTGPEVPRPEYQAQVYWGISALEVVYEELRKRDNASWAILQLLFRAQIISQVNPTLEQAVSGIATAQGAQTQFGQRMEAMNQLLSNQSMLILPKDGKLESISYSFAGISQVYEQFQLDIAGAAEMPVSRLFGRTITGLGQGNDADERMWEERIAQAQNEHLRPQLMKLYPVMMMSLFGEVPDDLDFTFPSVRVLTEEEKAQLTKDGAAAIIEAYNAGLISQQLALMELKQMGDTTGFFTNITAKIIKGASTDVLDMSENDLTTDDPDAKKDLKGGGDD